MKTVRVIVALAFAAALITGCESTPDKPADAPITEAPKTAPKDSASSKGDAGASTGATKPIADDDKPPVAPGVVSNPADGPMGAKNVVYFDFDRYDIKPEFRETVLAHAAHLSKNPSAKLVVEGHCDERGTPEYNIGLGDRRANAVRQLLKLQGVSDKQVEVISYGELRPVALGHDENSWWQNRRAMFIYK